MLIDGHVHCVPFRQQEEFFRVGLPAIFGHFPAGELKEPLENLLTDMDGAGVDSSIVITAGEMEIFEEFAETHPNRLYAAYIFDSRQPRESLKRLRKAVQKHPRLIKSVKTVFPYLGQNPAQKEFFPLYRFCQEKKLPVQFHMGGDEHMEQLSNLLYFARLACMYPNLKLVCLHAGGGQVGTLPLFLSHWKNVFVEVEGLQLMEAEGAREPGILRYLLENVDNRRIIFGSDRIFPEEKYFARVQTIRSIDGRNAENISWKNANRLFRLGITAKKIQKLKK